MSNRRDRNEFVRYLSTHAMLSGFPVKEGTHAGSVNSLKKSARTKRQELFVSKRFDHLIPILSAVMPIKDREPLSPADIAMGMEYGFKISSLHEVEHLLDNPTLLCNAFDLRYCYKHFILFVIMSPSRTITCKNFEMELLQRFSMEMAVREVPVALTSDCNITIASTINTMIQMGKSK